jgi:hypothetical protein
MAKPKARPTRSAKSAKRSANRLRDLEYKRLISRAETVGKQLEAADDDEAYQLEEGAWAKVIDSFDAWARKYNVKIETSRHAHGAGTGAGGGSVPRTSACQAITTSRKRTLSSRRAFSRDGR